LVVIGDGPDHKRLEKLAGRSVTFLTNVRDHEIAGHFQSAIAFILPNIDDFGIVAVEAMAAGTPIIAYKKGGALDYVIPGKTGYFFDKQTVDSLSLAIQSTIDKNFNHTLIAEQAATFSVKAFHDNLRSFVDNSIKLEDK
jgi:glycosyltransferase involved in cell wall biosynthesis